MYCCFLCIACFSTNQNIISYALQTSWHLLHKFFNNRDYMPNFCFLSTFFGDGIFPSKHQNKFALKRIRIKTTLHQQIWHQNQNKRFEKKIKMSIEKFAKGFLNALNAYKCPFNWIELIIILIMWYNKNQKTNET